METGLTRLREVVVRLDGATPGDRERDVTFAMTRPGVRFTLDNVHVVGDVATGVREVAGPPTEVRTFRRDVLPRGIGPLHERPIVLSESAGRLVYYSRWRRASSAEGGFTAAHAALAALGPWGMYWSRATRGALDIHLLAPEAARLQEAGRVLRDGLSGAYRVRVSRPVRARWRAAPAELLARDEEAVAVALKRGFFEVPRRAGLREVARELGVSHTMLERRLRRAVRELVRSHAGE